MTLTTETRRWPKAAQFVPLSERLVATDADTQAVAAESKCPRCGHEGLIATTWENLYEGQYCWFGCPECFFVQSV